MLDGWVRCWSSCGGVGERPLEAPPPHRTQRAPTRQRRHQRPAVRPVVRFGLGALGRPPQRVGLGEHQRLDERLLQRAKKKLRVDALEVLAQHPRRVVLGTAVIVVVLLQGGCKRVF